ncbi:MAG: SHOCT domain-containing protein [Gammaproteobacteria bacterium]|nr:SHOCT domain-containing protein [Gammaproteobacteria bacterium]
MMDWHWGHGGGYMYGFGWIFFVLFWAAVILAIVALLRWLTGPHGQTLPPPPTDKSALDILDERFARGEIDQQEYEQKRQVLKNNQ